MNEVIERRLEFLKLEAEGFSLCEIVKELSAKYQKTERTVYYDASTRETWQPLYTQLFELDKARLIVMNRYNYIYREASFNYRYGESSQKPIFLKLMLDVAKNLIELLGLQSIKELDLSKADEYFFTDTISWFIVPKSVLLAHYNMNKHRVHHFAQTESAYGYTISIDELKQMSTSCFHYHTPASKMWIKEKKNDLLNMLNNLES